MPDAARLVAAICIGLLGFGVSFLVIPLLPESMDVGYFIYINAGIGLYVGWTAMGKRAGRGLVSAINNGVGGALLLLLWALFVHGCIEMFDRAMANRYNGAFEALMAIVTLMAEYGLMLIDPLVIGTLIAGGVLAGLATEYAGRRWR